MRMGIKVDVKQALKIQKMVWEMMTLYNTFEKYEQLSKKKIMLRNFDSIWRLMISIAKRIREKITNF